MEPIGGDPGASLFSGSLFSRLDAADQLLRKAQGRFPLLDAFRLDARSLLLALLAALLLLVLPPLVGFCLRRFRHTEPNFRGDRIPQSFGVAILLYGWALYGAMWVLIPTARPALWHWIAAATGFGLLGLLDDLRGDKTIKGLRGHFRAATQGRLTTGLLKAVGGLGLALWLGWRLSADSPWLLPLHALLIALSANAFNLLDLRPGRAGGVFLLCAAPLLWNLFRDAGNANALPFLLIVLPTLVIWNQDARAKVMLGDAGSNLLGAALGLAFASSSVPLPGKIAALLLLIGLHLLAERASLTVLIERNRLLRALDRLTGIR